MLMTFVRGVIASLKAFSTSAALVSGIGNGSSFRTTPARLALIFQGCRPPGCSWNVRRTSSPALRSRPLATKLMPSVVFRDSAISSGSAPTNAAAFSRISSALAENFAPSDGSAASVR